MPEQVPHRNSVYWEESTLTALFFLLSENIDTQLFVAKIPHSGNNCVLEQHKKQDSLTKKSFDNRACL